MKSCVALLTKGYTELHEYNTLIKRNNHISQHLIDKSIDILIFHEGNISESHQVYIQYTTPDLKMKFIDISDIAFKPEKKDIRSIKEVETFPIGYKHMCSFWFVEFFEAVKEYDKLVRIDEDCFINFNIDELFLELDKYTFVTGIVEPDADSVTIGLNEFSLDFINKYKHILTFKNENSRTPGGPYTNVFCISLENVRNNNLFQLYRDEIDKSNMIYERRWGDLPLWGDVIQYIFGNEQLKVDYRIKYFHGSHGRTIN